MLESYPLYDEKIIDVSLDYQVDLLFNLIKDVRNYKIENKLAPNANLDLSLLLKEKMFPGFLDYLKRFSFSDIKLIDSDANEKGESHVYNEAELFIASQIDKSELLAKLDKEIENLQSEIKRCENMLNNPNFISKAPEAKIALEKEKLAKHQENLSVLLEKKKKI